MNYRCSHGYCRSKKLRFSCSQERVFACATVQFEWMFLKSAWYKNALITPGVIYRFCRIKPLQLQDLNGLFLFLFFFATNNFPKLSHVTSHWTLCESGCLIAKQ